TRFYAEVAAAPEGERAALLEAERARLAALAEDPVAQLMAADIARQIDGPNPTWHAVLEREVEARRELGSAVDAVAEAEASADEPHETDLAEPMEDPDQ